MTLQQNPVPDRQKETAAPSERLYAEWQRLHVRAVKGRFRSLKTQLAWVLLALYFVAPWMRWDRGPGFPDQAVLLDIEGRRAYLFDLVLWPQDLYFLTGLMIVAALGLFLATTLFGRLWCGYGCPQTVWTDLFIWVEHRTEGDRNARIKLDAAPWSVNKLVRKAAKHAGWLSISIATGAAFVFFFTDAPTALMEMLRGDGSSAAYIFTAIFAASTYFMAGWAREQFCTYLCPWPRLQAPMLDEHSLTVAYDVLRGEPRAKHRVEGGPRAGDCVDCSLCVQVCPAGIDIRDGAQAECITCGLCVDACNGVMKRIGKAPDLIAWTSLARDQARLLDRPYKVPFLRSRVMVYAGLMALVVAVMVYGLATRHMLEVTAQQDRSPLFVQLADGSIRNAYTVKLLNKDDGPRSFRLSVVADMPVEARLIGDQRLDAILVDANAVRELRLLVTSPGPFTDDDLRLVVSDPQDETSIVLPFVAGVK